MITGIEEARKDDSGPQSCVILSMPAHPYARAGPKSVARKGTQHLAGSTME